MADATSVFALVSTFWSCDFSALRPPLLATFTFPVSLIACSKLLRSEQYAGLLLPPQALNATATATPASRAEPGAVLIGSSLAGRHRRLKGVSTKDECRRSPWSGDARATRLLGDSREELEA